MASPLTSRAKSQLRKNRIGKKTIEFHTLKYRDLRVQIGL